MAQVSATSSLDISAAPDVVFTALSDYETVRPRILSERYRDYRVDAGGQGAGTVVHWILQAIEKRQRDVAPAGHGSTVTTTTEWKGAGGIGSFVEKTFAPLGLKKIQARVLQNLSREVE